MTVLRVTVPDQYFCPKHPDLNITAREKKVKQGQVSLLMEKYSPLNGEGLKTLNQEDQESQWEEKAEGGFSLDMKTRLFESSKKEVTTSKGTHAYNFEIDMKAKVENPVL